MPALERIRKSAGSAGHIAGVARTPPGTRKLGIADEQRKSRGEDGVMDTLTHQQPTAAQTIVDVLPARVQRRIHKLQVSCSSSRREHSAQRLLGTHQPVATPETTPCQHPTLASTLNDQARESARQKTSCTATVAHIVPT